MEELKTEYILLEKCRCCLGDGTLKDMWGEYVIDDRKEVYGDMLFECYSIQFQEPPNSAGHADQICESCVSRLRDALDFKREVLACEQLRVEHLNSGIIIKLEQDEMEIETELVEGDMDLPYSMDEMDYSIDRREECVQSEVDYEDVQYLEIEDVDPEENPKEPSSPKRTKRTPNRTVKTKAPKIEDPDYDEHAKSPEPPKRKWPRRKKKHEKFTLYKQYTRDDMLNALEAVEKKKMTKSEAAKHYNVPRKTLTAKLLLAKNPEQVNGEKEEKKRRYFQFIDDIRLILTYTNAVPFKTVTSKFYCAYCSTDGPHFEEPEELRIHTRTKHVDERVKNIEMALRPHWQNEVLKVDIDSLHCTVCCTIIPNWNSMFKHLEEQHQVELDEAYTKVIPYIIDRNFKCALCSEGFPNYHHLDSHMNAHYLNHVCPECGDTFLSLSRMNKHLQVHMTGKFPCEACGKVFSRDKYRQKHFDHVHKQEHNIKCLYCSEKFYGLYQRHLHVVSAHEEKVKITTCELCGLRFEWKPYYLAHMRRKHNVKKTEAQY